MAGERPSRGDDMPDERLAAGNPAKTTAIRCQKLPRVGNRDMRIFVDDAMVPVE